MNKISGTKEWAVKNINIDTGCVNNCRYCYARHNAMRFKRTTVEKWTRPVTDQKKVDEEQKKYPGTVMYTSTHDIYEGNVNESITVLKRLLDKGNDVLIVTKPRFHCVRLICLAIMEEYKNYTDSFWIGKLNKFNQRVDLSDTCQYDYDKYIGPLKKAMTDRDVLEKSGIRVNKNSKKRQIVYNT